MIKIIENNSNNITIREYPTQYWLTCLWLTIFAFLMNCWVLFHAPIYSSLDCHKTFFNTTNCELIESSLLNSDLRHKTIKNLHPPKEILNNGTIWLNTEIDLLHNPLLFLPLSILPGIAMLLVVPIKTYEFDIEQKQLKIVFQNILEIMEISSYPFDELKLVFSNDERSQSISIFKNKEIISELKIHHNEIDDFNNIKIIERYIQ